MQRNESGEKCFEVAATEIKIKNEKEIFVEKAATKIFFEEHYISHPSVKIKYLISEKTLCLIAEDKGRSTGPFYNSYHQVQIYSPKLDVVLKENKIIIN